LDYSDYDSNSEQESENLDPKFRKRELDNDIDYDELSDINIKKSKYDLEKMKEIANYSKLENGKLRPFSSIKNRYRKLTDRKEVQRIINYVENGGTYLQKVKEIENYLHEKFVNSRQKNLRITDMNLKMWALNKSRELNFNFKASDSWISSFKKKYRIKSRKITKYVTYKLEANEKQKVEKAKLFVQNIKEIAVNYSPDHIFNSDQSGFNYEITSNRTLSNIGEKDTFVIINSANAISHSYTIQPLISFEGKLVGKLFLCLKELNGKFGPIVENQLFKANNVITVCSSSGKLNKELVKVFSHTIVKPNVNKDFILILDSWAGHNKIELYNDIFTEYSCNLQIIPPGTTAIIQPADTVLFLQWKYFARKMYNHVLLEDLNIELHLRNSIIKMQSLIFNQLQSPLFYPMLRYSWHKSGYTEERPEKFDTVKEICFEFGLSHCYESNCKEISFINCSICRKILCFTHFFVFYHIHE
jgi:hypothetical protein